MSTRRDFHRIGTFLLGGLMALVLAVPGVGYLLTPILKRRGSGAETSDGADESYFDLARLSELTEGVPKSFSILAERQDAWVRYPREPLGSVWLLRQPAGSSEPVIAYTAECPHLGCSVNLSADGQRFACPCHNSAFTLEGTPVNSIPPRPMDRLAVQLSDDADPRIRVRFERFRTMAEEKIPLG
jgi:menaquinol-cytochrome c reductase iron-sulfur subunit